MTDIRHRNYCFTINNYDDDDIGVILELIDNGIFTYVVAGFEIGKKKGTPHIQGYCHLSRAMTMKALSKYMSRARLSVLISTPEQASEYCKKDAAYYEYGVLPSQGSATWDKIEYAMEHPRECIQLYNQYQKSYKAIRRSEMAQCANGGRSLVYSTLDNLPHYIENAESIGDLKTYDGEDICVCDFTEYQLNSVMVKLWDMGKKATIRRGYELIPFIPTKLIVTTNNEELLNHTIENFNILM